ncbi:MAG: hypothetical protein ACYDBR_05995 [Gaiellaceae bacterium]
MQLNTGALLARRCAQRLERPRKEESPRRAQAGIRRWAEPRITRTAWPPCSSRLRSASEAGGAATRTARLVARSWYDGGMARTRISTTVDAELLESARQARSGVADSALIDEALAALMARQRAVEFDAAYAAYDAHPLDEADAWGDLASFRAAASAS